MTTIFKEQHVPDHIERIPSHKVCDICGITDFEFAQECDEEESFDDVKVSHLDKDGFYVGYDICPDCFRKQIMPLMSDLKI